MVSIPNCGSHCGHSLRSFPLESDGVIITAAEDVVVVAVAAAALEANANFGGGAADQSCGSAKFEAWGEVAGP